MSAPPIQPPAEPVGPAEPAGGRLDPRRGRLLQELLLRALFGAAVFVFDALPGTGADNYGVRLIAMVGIALNIPYYLVARTGAYLYAQAYVRFCVDVLLVTVALYAVGGLQAAPYISVYAVILVYAGVGLSSTACLVAAGFSTVSYLALVGGQQVGWIPVRSSSALSPWSVAGFNLLVLNVLGVSTALLAERVRSQRVRLRTLNDELETRARRLRAFVDVTQQMNRGLELPSVMDSITAAATRVFGGEAGVRLIEDNTLVRISATPGAREAMVEERIAVGESLSGHVATTGAPLVVSDTASDTRLIPVHRAAIHPDRTGAMMCLPIRAGTRILGTLNVYRERGHQFDAAAVELGMTLADHAGIAIENARLYQEVQQAYEGLREAQAQFLQSQKMEAVGRLAGGVAHDFNNLLTVIIGRTALLKRRLASNGTGAPDLAMIDQAAQHAAALTQQLLAFSRKQILEPLVIDLNATITEFVPMLQRLIGEDITLRTALAPTLGRVRADRNQMHQLLMNLAANARDAMPKGGTVTIETADVELDATYARRHVVEPGAYVMMSVADTGVGMDAATLARVFEPFFTSKPTGKGTGLGLATVYGIVRQHGGHIWPYSEPGHGAVFKIYLPRVDAPVDEPVAVPPAPAPGGTETVLLVEDEDDVRDLISDILEAGGYRVLAARDGQDALDIAERHREPIHLVLTDAVMPRMGGPDLVQRLAPLHPETRVLFASGYTDSTLILHGLRAAGAAFLQKPFTSEVLMRRVRQILDRESPPSSMPSVSPPASA